MKWCDVNLYSLDRRASAAVACYESASGSILEVNRSRFEKEVGLIPLTRNLPTGEKDSDCSKDLALEHQTSAGA